MFILLQKLLRPVFERIELLFSYLFDDDWNPMFYLGALSFYFFWIVIGTGLYLYCFFNTSIFGAYSSIEALTHEQWYIGGVMRSLHRYCSDAMAVTVTLHLMREFSMGRYNGVRWFSWVSGVPLLWLLFAAAIGGYWLVWDQFAQFVAVFTSEWLDWLPNFSDPMARNFLTNDSISDRLFSLLVFLHIGIPLFLLLGMFIHIKQIANAKSNPPRGLAIGTLAAFIALSLVKPAVSAAPADLSKTQPDMQFDWFFLNIYPLIDNLGPGWVWAILGGITVGLGILPLLSRERESKPAAVVDPDNCNGCGWCVQDCPYGAIEFQPHVSKAGHRMAVVDADACTACGICSGSCPTATPFQHVDELKSGIGMPFFELDTLKKETLERLEPLKGSDRIIVYGCDHGANLQTLLAKNENVAGLSLPCIGFLPPSFVDFILRKNKADGVLITGCCSENCFFRQGSKWTEERFKGERFPHLRTQVANDANNVRIRWAGALEAATLQRELTSFKDALKIEKDTKAKKPIQVIMKGKRYVGQAISYVLFVSLIGFFSTSPAYTRVPEGFATVKVSFRHSGQILGECHQRTAEELQQLSPNMRSLQTCPRERSPIEFVFYWDGKEIYHELKNPAGLHRDGRSNLYRRLTVDAGQHTLTAKLKDRQNLGDYNYNITRQVNLNSGDVLVVDFDSDAGSFKLIQ